MSEVVPVYVARGTTPVLTDPRLVTAPVTNPNGTTTAMADLRLTTTVGGD